MGGSAGPAGMIGTRTVLVSGGRKIVKAAVRLVLAQAMAARRAPLAEGRSRACSPPAREDKEGDVSSSLKPKRKNVLDY